MVAMPENENEQYEASVELEDEHAFRGVVDDFDDVVLRITGSNIEGEDGIDIELDQMQPQDNAVLELIEDDRVLARFIQGDAR